MANLGNSWHIPGNPFRASFVTPSIGASLVAQRASRLSPIPPTHDLTLTHHTSAETAKLMDELCDVYADTHALYERWSWRKMGIVPGKPGAYYPEYVRFVLPLPLTTAGR